MTVVEGATTASHACAVPVSDEQLWEMTARFLADGLTAGEHVLYLDDGTIDAVLERLDDDGVPYRGALGSGQFAVAPPEMTRGMLRMPAAQMIPAASAALDDALGRGYPAVRFVGDSAAAFEHEDGAAFLEYEAALDDILSSRAARCLCLYDRRRFSDDAIARLRDLHHTEIVAPALYDDNLLRITTSGPSVARVAGEIDHSNRPLIRRALDSALDEALRSHSASSEITLDLSSLRFIDVAGAVSLVHAAEEFPDTHHLVLTGVRPGVGRLLDRCGAPFARQLRVLPRVEPTAPEAPESLEQSA